MNKIKKSTNNNNDLNNHNNFGVWETIDLLTKQQTTNSGQNVYNNIQEWLYKVTNKLSLNKLDRNTVTIDEDSSQIGLTHNSMPGMDSGTCNSSTPRRPNVKNKSKKVNHIESKCLLDAELMLSLNGLSTPATEMGAKKKKKKTSVNKLPKISSKNKTIKGERFDDDEELYKANYFGSLVDCNFNLPRVSAQLEKLMGTNIVRLTDRNYMQQLRIRIQEEYHATLQKRINQREAREMERERNLIMSGKGETCPHDLADHPVFIINQETNEQIAKARSKLKTTREKNAERLVRQGAKWEKEREIYEEMDRMKEVQRKEKREAELLREQEYANANKVRGIDLLRVKNRDYAENEMALKTFMDAEREKMLCRTGAEAKRLKIKHQKVREKLFRPPSTHEEDYDDIEGDEEGGHEGEFEENEAEYLEHEEEQEIKDGIVQIHPPAHDKNKGEVQSAFETAGGSLSTSQFENDDVESYAPSITTVEIEELLTSEEQAEIAKQHMAQEDEYLKYHYEDPKIVKLKNADNVLDLYELADEIIGGTAATLPKKVEKHE